MSTPTKDDRASQYANVFVEPKAYADDARLHEALAYLREHEPVVRVESRLYRPFWAVTKHADIMAIERDNNLFLS